MLEVLGAICGTSIWFALICWIIGAKKNKRFIRAGLITWLLCAFLYGLFSGPGSTGENFILFFFIGMFLYSFGCALWTGLVVYLDKTGKNVKWVLKYIPLGMIGLIVIVPVVIFGVNTAMQTQKRILVQEEIALISSGIQQLFGEYDDYSHLNNDTIFGAIGVSNKNPYGGLYRVETFKENPHFFVVSVSGISPKDCKYFLTHKWTESALYQLDKNQYNGAVSNPEDCSANYNTISILYN